MHLRKMEQAIYGWALERQAWVVTRMTDSSFSLPPIGFQPELFRACSSIANGGSGLRPVWAALLALTTRRQSARRPLITRSLKGFQVTGCGALLRTTGVASTLEPLTASTDLILRQGGSGIPHPWTDWLTIR